MAHRHSPSSSPAPEGALGIEAGGTRTTAIWASDTGAPTRTWSGGPANLQLLDDLGLRSLLSDIAAALPCPRTLAIGMAGVRTAGDRARVANALTAVWPGTPAVVTNDLEIALAAAAPLVPSTRRDRPRVLVLSGTGSCCYAQVAERPPARAGGWGHLLGDGGSGHAIGLAALREAVREFDENSRWTDLGVRLLAALQLNEPNALIPWIQNAAKADIAALAPVVFAAAQSGDPIARRVIADAARSLATSAVACARKWLAASEGRTTAGPPSTAKSGLESRGRTSVGLPEFVFVFAGGVLLGQPRYAAMVARTIREACPRATFVRLSRPGAAGALTLARSQRTLSLQPESRPSRLSRPRERTPLIPESTQLSPTEERNPRSLRLDRLSLSAAVDLMLAEDTRIYSALRAVQPQLVRALGLISKALSAGGRLFYVGAGTSGRLGILDASECPPTFSTPPELVQGIIAGGQIAIFRSVEGAEDDFAGGAASIRFRCVSRRDVVVGIAASGRTPFVWGALTEARTRGAATVLICFNPHLRFRKGARPDVVIAPRVGPELLTGSTRLKAGTATKLILNLLSTLAMVRLGKVVSNLMVDVHPANLKLRERAVRIVRELTAADVPTATAALEASGWRVKDAVRRLGHSRARGTTRSRRRAPAVAGSAGAPVPGSPSRG